MTQLANSSKVSNVRELFHILFQSPLLFIFLMQTTHIHSAYVGNHIDIHKRCKRYIKKNAGSTDYIYDMVYIGSQLAFLEHLILIFDINIGQFVKETRLQHL